MTEFESDLRRVLQDERLTLAPAQGAFDAVRHGIVRRRRHRYSAGVAATTLAVAAAVAIPTLALTGGQTPPADQVAGVDLTGAVPWLDLPGRQPDPHSPAPRQTARACTAADIPDSVLATGNGAASGSTYYQLALKTSTSRCTLADPPVVYGHDATGKLVQLSPGQLGAPDVPQDAQTPATIDPGEAAYAVFTTSTNCGGPRGGAVYHDLEVEVAGKRVPVPGLSVNTTCGVSTSGWYRLPGPDTRYDRLRIEITAPASAKAGTTLVYRVTLHNDADAPLALDPCPVYQQTLGTSDSAPLHTLNCAPGQLPAHGSVSFQMRLPIPATTAPGLAQLQWQIIEGSGPSNGSAAKLTITAG